MTTKSERISQRRARSARIVARMRKILPQALVTHSITAAYVSGSVAHGTATPMSDVDIALVIEPLTQSSYNQLKLELSSQADIEDAARAVARPAGTEADAVAPIGLPEIDVRIINNVPLTVRGRILQEGVMVYEGNHQARVDFEVATRRRYFDFAPVAERLQEALLDHVHREGILNG